MKKIVLLIFSLIILASCEKDNYEITTNVLPNGHLKSAPIPPQYFDWENDQIISGDPFHKLNRIIEAHKIENDTTLPFIGGGIGYFSYDLVRSIEKLPDLSKDIVDIPAVYYVFYDNIVIYNHHNNRVYISGLNRIDENNDQIDIIEDRIKKGEKIIYKELVEDAVDFQSPFNEDTYMEAVKKMRNYIKRGHIYIANMTHTYLANTDRKAYDIYKVLRKINQAPFSAYMPLDGFEIMCSSPERFMKIVKGKVETRPIKGTRPRGNTDDEDLAYRRELENSEKDHSELLMIVDLERNDLSKVCRPYTVKVTELFNIESYATVHHLVSTVVGELRKEYTAVDCMKACFPGGSITGTPKIRAMEVIEELEPTKRNLYTGCIGYLGFDGGADFNIVIRTILKQGNQLSIGVGGGITWESDEKAEYEETLDKAKALFEAVRLREE